MYIAQEAVYSNAIGNGSTVFYTLLNRKGKKTERENERKMASLSCKTGKQSTTGKIKVQIGVTITEAGEKSGFMDDTF
jgi:hypothetical protein